MGLVGTARARVPLLDGDGPLAAGALHVEKGAVGKERGGGVGRRRRRADVAADGAGDAQLRAAGGIAGLAQRGHGRLDDGARGHVVEPGDGADLDGTVLRQRHAVELVVQLMDGHEMGGGALALAKLHEDVRAARDDLGLGVLGQGAAGIVDARGLVQGFDVVHQMSPSFLKPSNSRWGVMGST